ncbi:ubiquitin-protein ligase E3A-like [Dreissena polymorpha]|uniref:Ubiquitin-protein ligase E3A n=1 Tax=Dreissena polymorpha TaxID=45954 RepID=A0A9D4BZ86_DREPO|nr:ubiquitin-protein ligase E3A-like [Dreissena polymorpha]KAH3713647.1 hypothetical protein DPMN_073444 [Dreissena polymorpha]
MNNTDKTFSESGKEAASANYSVQAEAPPAPDMKRSAAKQLIEVYYSQLTDGCGNDHCSNVHCASSPYFELRGKDCNALAVKSIDLYKDKAQLCEQNKNKIPRNDELVVPGPSSQKKPETSVVPKTLSLTDGVVQEHATASTSNSPLGAFPKSKTAIATVTKETVFLNKEKLDSILDECKEMHSWSSLVKTIGLVFSNPDTLLQSFQCKERDDQMEVEHDKFIDIQKTKAQTSTLGTKINVDLDSLREAYSSLVGIPDLPFQNALINAIVSLSKAIVLDLRYNKPIEKCQNYLNIFVIIMEIPLLHSPEFIDSAYPEFCKALGRVPLAGQSELAKYWSKFSAERLQEMVQSLQQLITVKLCDADESRWSNGAHLNDDEIITGPVRVMKILYYASLYGGVRDSIEMLKTEQKIVESENELQSELFAGAGAVGMDREIKEIRQANEDPLGKELGVRAADCRKPLVPFEDFVNELLNEKISVETDYKYKLESEGEDIAHMAQVKFSFANHSFILNMPSKQMSLYLDSRVQMYKERRSSVIQTLIHGWAMMPFLRLRVSRNSLINDALVALEMIAMENPADLRKQLYVEFEGEQGVDEGGVSKEFFQLIVDEIFNVDFGMFTYNTDTHTFWFNSMSFENDGQFTLIGIVLGLAIYNSTIVDVHFPPVVYRKLAGKLGTFADMKDVDPTLAQSLHEMLDYGGEDFEDVFMQTFLISYKDVFGSTITHELRENGDSIPVTQENKRVFVDMYADFILNKSIERQFRAFRRGFAMVTNESPLRTLFRPDEVELLICGSEDYDFVALENACDYDGGFDKNSQTIRDFWEAVHSFTDAQKRQLVQFTTGTDRVPVGGLSKLKLIIARNGPDSDRLPTAHTCFNVLLLPDYQNKDKLKERLLKAITYSKGFGLL